MIVRGIDVSSHQDPSGSGDRNLIDWRQVKPTSYDFGLARMTIGKSTLDEDGRQNLKAMAGQIPVAGAYGVVGYTEPVEDGAKLLLDEIAAAGADPASILVMLDAEDFGQGGPFPGIDQVDRYARQVHADLGRWPVAYVPSWWLDGHHFSVAGRALASCPWAPSHYYPSPWTEALLQSVKPANLHGFRSLAWLQYTSSASVPGVSGRVDANVFYGSLDQMRATLLQEDDMTKQEFLDALREELGNEGRPTRKFVRELAGMGARDALGATLDDEAKFTVLAQQMLAALQADPAERIDETALGQRMAEILHTLGLPVTIADDDIQRNLTAVLERSRLEVSPAG